MCRRESDQFCKSLPSTVQVYSSYERTGLKIPSRLANSKLDFSVYQFWAEYLKRLSLCVSRPFFYSRFCLAFSSSVLNFTTRIILIRLFSLSRFREEFLLSQTLKIRRLLLFRISSFHTFSYCFAIAHIFIKFLNNYYRLCRHLGQLGLERVQQVGC